MLKPKDTIIKETLLEYVTEHLSSEIDTYYRLSHSHPCERVQWQLVTHLVCVYKTLISLDTELQQEYSWLTQKVSEFENLNIEEGE
ncbi:hypothetical protein VPIG_00018 [Vibrio phage PWH3a-P1]|uniref:hypothetical protein n=1 Tax=Vibrio phage PWH3a-P1 TaxID=754058 RepID=UPI0002C12D02|nr:hypothetical protein VPIG_00018 [Vibrio phage PWH3a-P1]AGH31876.1 hypothetical protein VPIG_00018 [Vibrio phage PWH3a-P1]